jgi:ADP-ribose pyrophosphatase
MSSSSSSTTTLKKWKTLKTETVFEAGKWLRVEKHAVEISAAQTIDDWSFIVTPNFVNVAAVTSEGEWLFFRQTKYAPGFSLGDDELLACVGGYVGGDEAPRAAAQRELLEETGFVGGEWHHLTSGVPDANRGCGVGHLYLALDCRPPPPDEAATKGVDGHDDLETQLMVRLTTDEAETAALNGEFKCHSWAACVATALLFVRKRERERAASVTVAAAASE